VSKLLCFRQRHPQPKGQWLNTPSRILPYRTAGDPRYRGRDWSDVEDDLRTDYLRKNPNSAWERMKGAIRYGWEKVTGKR